jgi:D-alanine-D-alanine ligase
MKLNGKSSAWPSIKPTADVPKRISKMKIAVLLGGPSSERAVSLKSGAAVAEALKKLGASPVKILVGRDTSWLARLKRARPDFVFIALHGKYGEDGAAQSELESRGFAYCGSGPAASALAMDKAETKRVLEASGIRTPAGRIARRGMKVPAASFPCVVKPSDEGSAVGVSIARSRKELLKAVKSALKYSSSALIEKYIPGVEITAAVLDGKCLPLIEIVPKGSFYDYRSKYSPGMSDHIVPARITPAAAREASKIAVRSFRRLGCRAFGRVDMKVAPDGRIYVFEVNTIPGLTSTSLFPDAARAAGISFEHLIERMIRASLLSFA